MGNAPGTGNKTIIMGVAAGAGALLVGGAIYLAQNQKQEEEMEQNMNDSVEIQDFAKEQGKEDGTIC